MIYHRLYHGVQPCRRYGIVYVLLAVLLAASASAPAPSSAQTYPTKPVRIIVPTSPGGITDTLARALAQRLTESFGQPVIVENRPAGAGHLGMDFVAKSAPDGYTLMVNSDAAFVVNPHLYSKLPYDPINDFIPISGLGISPQALVLHPSVPANTFNELVAYAKTRPGELNYGTFGIGTSGHLNIIHLENETGTKFTPVHYRGAAPAITDLLGGHIQMMIVAIGLLQQNLEAGKLKALGYRQPAAPAAISRPADDRTRAGCRTSRPARGTASPRPRARRARSSTSSAPRRRRFSAIRRSAKNSWRPRVTFSIASPPDQFAERMRADLAEMGQGHQGRRHQGGVTGAKLGASSANVA